MLIIQVNVYCAFATFLLSEAQMETWKPVGKMVLVRKDEDKETTSGGIILPDSSKIPVITCVVIAIGPQVDTIGTCPISNMDRIIVDPTNAIPISFESNEKRYVIDSEKILAVQERTSKNTKKIKAYIDDDYDDNIENDNEI